MEAGDFFENRDEEKTRDEIMFTTHQHIATRA